MALVDDLRSQVATIFAEQWKSRNGTVVPEETSLALGNDGTDLDATILYADLSDSTKLVDSQPAYLAAEIYKAFLRCAARIITSEGGTITAYDGDRVMAVYLGASKNTSAVRTALKINWACKCLIQPAFNARYAQLPFVLKHTVGVDTSKVRVARAGIRGSNDLVWIGRSANWAAKLCALSHDYPSWITGTVFDGLHESVKTTDGKAMWEKRLWTTMDNAPIYRSTWWWKL